MKIILISVFIAIYQQIRHRVGDWDRRSNGKKQKQSSIFASLKVEGIVGQKIKQNYRRKQQKTRLIKTGMRFQEKDEVDCKNNKAWIKYLIVEQNKPLAANFFINKKYDHQAFLQSEEIQKATDQNQKAEIVKQHLKNNSDSFGPLDIPGEVYFFGMLSDDSIYVLDQRQSMITKTYDIIDIAQIKKLKDEGDFKEGSCMRLIQSLQKNYIICFDASGEKHNWIKYMQEKHDRLKPEEEREPEPPVDPNKEISIPGFEVKPSQCDKKKPSKKKVDGKWIILQDWTQCTVVCGGGTQTQQRMCIPPENGGKECEGEPISTRPCNSQPCKDNSPQKVEYLPPKIKLQQTINRHQRYEKCVINEGDIDVVETQLEQFQIKPRLPGWAVLNTRTLSVFMGEKYDQAVFVAKLDQISSISNYDQDPSLCFVVQTNVPVPDPTKNKMKEITLCSLEQGKQDLEEVKQNWIDRINFFKDNCQTDYIPKKKTKDVVLEMKKQEIENVEKQECFDDFEVFKNKGQEQNKMNLGMGEFQNMAMEAMTKEMKYEQMIEDEEKKREENESQQMAVKLEEICEKEDCVKHGLKKTEKKKQESAQVKFDALQFDDLKNQIKEMIMKKRKEKNDKIALMKKLFDMRKQKQMGQIFNKRVEMATEMIKAQKEGNETQCTQVTDEDSQCEYCNSNFKNDIQQLNDCKNPNQYCYICCENEFGETHADEREKCFEKCAGLDSGSSDDKSQGNWVWVPRLNKVS